MNININTNATYGNQFHQPVGLGRPSHFGEYGKPSPAFQRRQDRYCGCGPLSRPMHSAAVADLLNTLHALAEAFASLLGEDGRGRGKRPHSHGPSSGHRNHRGPSRHSPAKAPGARATKKPVKQTMFNAPIMNTVNNLFYNLNKPVSGRWTEGKKKAAIRDAKQALSIALNRAGGRGQANLVQYANSLLSSDGPVTKKPPALAYM